MPQEDCVVPVRVTRKMERETDSAPSTPRKFLKIKVQRVKDENQNGKEHTSNFKHLEYLVQ